jgi:hypothetical protein
MYLPQYEMAMVEGNPTGVMCSYNTINSFPSCANNFLINQILQKCWNQPNAAHVTTNCGTADLLWGTPVFALMMPLLPHMLLWMGLIWKWDPQSGRSTIEGLATKEAANCAFMCLYWPHLILGYFDDLKASRCSTL